MSVNVVASEHFQVDIRYPIHDSKLIQHIIYVINECYKLSIVNIPAIDEGMQ
jgi:hypothetical protein